jgi:hypothetical protein
VVGGLRVVAGADPEDPQLLIYHAESGTDSAQALALLGTIAATGERDPAIAGSDVVS